MMGPEQPLIAAVTTTYFPNSHAGVIISRFLRGFPTDDGLIEPRTRIASLYIDQIHARDVGLQLAHDHDVPVFGSIRSALTLGGDNVAVDGVLLIAEHGDYGTTALGQEMLPRRYFFEQICASIEESGRPIPVFSDKHLSYRWEDARWMYERAQELKIPFWAASALPVGWRRPNRDHPIDDPIEDAVVIGFHMAERYGFHALEALQCQLERRKGGETGIRSVQCLSGDSVWQSGRDGVWSWELAECALQAIEDGPDQLSPGRVENPLVYLLEYRDGVKAAVTCPRRLSQLS